MEFTREEIHAELVEARNILADGGWCRLAFRTSVGDKTLYCASGVFLRRWNLGDKHDEALKLAAFSEIEKLAPGRCVVVWNDEEGRTIEEVLQLFDKAIANTAPEPMEVDLKEEVLV